MAGLQGSSLCYIGASDICRLAASLLFPKCVLHCCIVRTTVTSMSVQVSRSGVTQNVLLTEERKDQRNAQQLLRGLDGRTMRGTQVNGKRAIELVHHKM